MFDVIQPRAALISATEIPSSNTACIVPSGILQVRLWVPTSILQLPPGHSYHLTLSCTSPLRQRRKQRSLEQGCSSWMPCNSCLYLSPLYLFGLVSCFLGFFWGLGFFWLFWFWVFFFGTLPSHRLLSSPSAPFLSSSWMVRAQPSPQQKGEGLGVFGGQQ